MPRRNLSWTQFVYSEDACKLRGTHQWSILSQGKPWARLPYSVGNGELCCPPTNTSNKHHNRGYPTTVKEARWALKQPTVCVRELGSDFSLLCAHRNVSPQNSGTGTTQLTSSGTWSWRIKGSSECTQRCWQQLRGPCAALHLQDWVHAEAHLHPLQRALQICPWRSCAFFPLSAFSANVILALSAYGKIHLSYKVFPSGTIKN